MLFIEHLLAYFREFFKVLLFCGYHRVSLKMREDFANEFSYAANFILECFVGPVRSDRSASEMLFHLKQRLRAVGILADGKAWPDIPAELVTLAFVKCDAKTAFTVYNP